MHKNQQNCLINIFVPAFLEVDDVFKQTRRQKSNAFMICSSVECKEMKKTIKILFDTLGIQECNISYVMFGHTNEREMEKLEYDTTLEDAVRTAKPVMGDVFK
ncbi:hypothetical protein T08_7414 [Trichinella sp. T8]|nr:hypothetical protein T08_7414 [Trichinella sp. T8]